MFTTPFTLSNPLECLEVLLYTLIDTDTNSAADPSIFTVDSSGSVIVNSDDPANC